jgi:hypothetical protein
VLEKYKQMPAPATVPEGFTLMPKKMMESLVNKMKKAMDNKELM